ncbi:TlpA family protein disulfide reductase [Allomuricauda sp. SCSIO 65647]|uniref:TlpA family protein disulfide reductase n=1 Tax=Allomuricauda sp. SCSIO 65647 TaxID=2908843 RepID=UPI001F165035|nr:TlpA disulfide reductase family protein [Muricauda sp. SCSIO 65647]UJH67986.1 TlpA family protein disulfide reductase [Muricauda sp. SCSIO 65647]
MKFKRKTVLNLLLILFVLSFFVTPMGYYGKLFLIRAFNFGPKVIAEQERKKIVDYDWKLKDANWDFFNFENSKDYVVFINFWASWKLISEAELHSIQKLYDKYAGEVVFYVITNEERPPVEEFMQRKEFTFPVTYLIIGEKAPVNVDIVPSSYIIDKEGNIAVHVEDGIANWNTDEIHQLLDTLIAR